MTDIMDSVSIDDLITAVKEGLAGWSIRSTMT